MKRILLFLVLPCIAQTDPLQRIYGTSGAQLSTQQISFITTLNRDIDALSPAQQAQEATAVEKELARIQTSNAYDHFLVETQLTHFQQITQQANGLSTYVHSFFYTPQHTQRILTYLDIERTHILHNYEQCHHFFIELRIHPLHHFFSIWNNPHLQHRVLTYTKHHQQQVVTQGLLVAEEAAEIAEAGTGVARIARGATQVTEAVTMRAAFQIGLDRARQLFKTIMANPLYSMGLQMGISIELQSAYGMVAQWVDANNAALFKNLQQQETGLKTSFDNFISDQKKIQDATIAQLQDIFAKQQNDIGTQYTQANAQLIQELTYLKKSISLSLPKRDFLISPASLAITYDQLFAHSKMLTPQGPYTWYNITQCGNWMYNPTNDSFTQQELVPFTPEPNAPPAQAQNNAIFTEYISDTSQYDIQVELTLYEITYPFFAGIMFHKARWVSGDLERFRQCRLVGIYGKTDSTGIHFAQQRTTEQTIVSPLELIVSPQSTNVIPLKPLVCSPESPITFKLTINTSPESIRISLSQGTQVYDTVTLDRLDPSLCIYHGIGFVSAGCTTQWKIITPIALTCSPQARTRFIEQMKTI